MTDGGKVDSPKAGKIEWETTASLLEQMREGNDGACDRLFERYQPILKRWAHGRLPRHIRGAIDTEDLVQTSLYRALTHIGSFVPKREGSFLAYLRRIVINQIRDELRRASRMTVVLDSVDSIPDPASGPFENAAKKEFLDAYDEALAKLSDKQQEALILRFELGFDFSRIAEAIESPSANAARMYVTRALVQLTEVMDEKKER